VLVVGAGGLGCEILKGLACTGFRNIDIIDMDTIDLSNLNRQFLFREEDIGQPKAIIAAKAVSDRIPDMNITPHFCQLQDMPVDFFDKFSVVIAGLDSIEARRYCNAVLHSRVIYDNNGTPDLVSQKPLIDGGTEGFKGHCRVVIPGTTSCLDCTLDLYPPQQTYPLKHKVSFIFVFLIFSNFIY
jgi:ubiquitin-activating enzyme E1 C